MTQELQPESLKEQGLAMFQRGDHDRALALFQEAEAAYAAQENATGQAEMLNNLGIIYRVRRQRQEAIAALTQAAEMFAAAGDAARRGQALGNLGDVYADMGKRDDAGRYYSEAVALLAGAGAAAEQSQVLRAMALLRVRQMRWLEAMTLMERSLAVRPWLSLGQRLFRGMLRFVLGLMGGGGRVG